VFGNAFPYDHPITDRPARGGIFRDGMPTVKRLAVE